MNDYTDDASTISIANAKSLVLLLQKKDNNDCQMTKSKPLNADTLSHIPFFIFEVSIVNGWHPDDQIQWYPRLTCKQALNVGFPILIVFRFLSYLLFCRPIAPLSSSHTAFGPLCACVLSSTLDLALCRDLQKEVKEDHQGIIL